MTSIDPGQFSGAGCLLFFERRLVLEVRKPSGWQHCPGEPTQIGLGCVGGTIEAGETPLQALHREVQEEICCSTEVRSAPRTADISPAGIRVIDGLEIDGVTPAMVWEVTDPIFVVGTKVAVFLGQVSGEPQPGDLPAIVITDPGLITTPGLESMSIAEVKESGAEIRERVELPGDGRFIPVNSLSRLLRLRSVEPELFNQLLEP